ncbi:hypothetical protein GCM10022295_27290 [Streptomyces osmaniensis]|uniref:Uncharacterized protein n=1 Tax=Streptomyces osmaniensis TaxID=593134 RepID=A0ABP6W1E2_9ACTN
MTALSGAEGEGWLPPPMGPCRGDWTRKEDMRIAPVARWNAPEPGGNGKVQVLPPAHSS